MPSLSLYAILIILIIITVALLIRSARSGKRYRPWIFEAPERRAGRRGEEKATRIISSVLREDDLLFTNVQINYENSPAELDNVIVNKYGVFIIEVKNYSGRLVGDEDDCKWEKFHTSDAGNTYQKVVKNPMKQVNRQIYVLSKYLRSNNAPKVWINGYSLLLQRNSPIRSEYILESKAQIDRAIHTPGRNLLTERDIEKISMLLS